jgi:hypothetical protein
MWSREFGRPMSAKIVVQGLWIGKSLSRVEKCCITSFLSHGHDFHLYTYDYVAGIPSGTTIRNGEEILSRAFIFLNSDRPTYSGFSNLFRYKLLHDRGGIWVDLDVVCLRPFAYPDECMIAQEIEANGSTIIATCVISAPRGSALMKDVLDEALGKDRGNQRFGELGPYFFGKFARQDRYQKIVMHPSAFCPIPYTNWSQLISGDLRDQRCVENGITTHTFAVHLWNEMWRSANVDKNQRMPSSCFFERTCSLMGI